MRKWIAFALLGALVLGIGAPTVWGGDDADKAAKDFGTSLEKSTKELSKFIKKHPDSEEAESARTVLAMIYGQFAPTEWVKAHIDDAKKVLADLEESGSRYAGRVKGRIIDAEIVGNEPPAIKTVAVDGKPISLEEYKGKVVLIDFWATWCGPCIAELPNLKSVYEKYKDKGFDVLGISLDMDDRQSVEDFVAWCKDNEMPWRQIRDGKGWKAEYAGIFGVSSIPKTYLLGRDGKVVEIGVRGEALEPAVAKLLGEGEG